MPNVKAPVQRLNFSRDSDDGDESSGYHSLDSSCSILNLSDENRDVSFGGSPDCWSPGLATPKASSKNSFRRTLRRSESPVDLDLGIQVSPDVSMLSNSKTISFMSNNTSDRSCYTTSTNGTPPHRRLKNLRLFDSPQTPKSLLQQQEQKSSERRRNRNIAGRLFSGGTRSRETKGVIAPRTRRRAAANVNPFTPQVVMNVSGAAKKRQRPERKNSITDELEPMDDEYDLSDTEFENPSKRVAIHDSNISRYNAEFVEISKIGCGEFGSVYKCVNRLDGCTYAVKKSKKPVAGSILEKMALNEVYAHAVLGAHIHVVRYFSAWAEDNHMIIQNEFCNGGSLADVIARNHVEGQSFSEPQLKEILLQVAKGLEYIHNQGLVHLDIKPGNIFISHQSGVKDRLKDIQEIPEDERMQLTSSPISPIYKIGDLGHVTSVLDPKVEEGDIRYLPNEILQEDYSHLPRGDIFSLALSVYECAGGGPLPKNGEEWHRIREGMLGPLRHLSHDLNELLKVMYHDCTNVSL
ncbi:putative wee1-like protein kinase 1-B-like [Apostichopus japonicus]|uniref:Wee1-like protein kinase n=1 Tax=Stichopus japonicus TaxID=307972 RepID=A0A2G8KVI3_STIJA|nr:putative wee1-like protein kinase 1-B-like [Apostichopus japonicus]